MSSAPGPGEGPSSRASRREPRVYAVVTAAGKSVRMGGGNKMLLPLQGKPVLAWSLELLDSHPAVAGIVVTASRDSFDAIATVARKCGKLLTVVEGGLERQDSVAAALERLPEDDGALAAVHDGARPLVTRDELSRLIEEALHADGGAILAVPARDTVKRVGAGREIVETLSRDEVWLAQTPQIFPLGLIRDAHRTARSRGLSVTDDASLVELLGRKVKVVQGSWENIKLTAPGDLALAEAILKGR